MAKSEILKKLKRGLIVSCQALPDEPLFSPFIMSRMAYAAMEGGASGIRANSGVDISEIKKIVDLPIIGLRKKSYDDSSVFITPTMLEVEEIINSGVDIIATDATSRLRPNGKTLDDFVEELKNMNTSVLLMADCSTYEEGIRAQELGFDIVGTTLNGYTDYTKNDPVPNYQLIENLSKDISIPVFAEGGIWSPDQLASAFSSGAYAVVVGAAITRPQCITRRFADAIC